TGDEPHKRPKKEVAAIGRTPLPRRTPGRRPLVFHDLPLLLSQRPASGDCVIKKQYYNRSDDRDEERVEIENRDFLMAWGGGDEDADDQCAYQAQHRIEDAAFALLVDDLARNETRNQAKQNPADNGHVGLSSRSYLERFNSFSVGISVASISFFSSARI